MSSHTKIIREIRMGCDVPPVKNTVKRVISQDSPMYAPLVINMGLLLVGALLIFLPNYPPSKQ